MEDKIIKRKLFICPFCEGVYADEPVTSCDCMADENDKFIMTTFEYTLNDKTYTNKGKS